MYPARVFPCHDIQLAAFKRSKLMSLLRARSILLLLLYKWKKSQESVSGSHLRTRAVCAISKATAASSICSIKVHFLRREASHLHRRTRKSTAQVLVNDLNTAFSDLNMPKNMLSRPSIDCSGYQADWSISRCFEHKVENGHAIKIGSPSLRSSLSVLIIPAVLPAPVQHALSGSGS